VNSQGENQERTLIEGAVAVGEQLAGKYMTFKLANEEYGLEILKVREIIGLMDITRVPCTQEFMSGVINLRGKVIPVIDLRLKFGMERCQVTDQTVIIVVQYSLHGRNMTMGLLVDQVLEVLSIEAAAIEQHPAQRLHPGHRQGGEARDLPARYRANSECRRSRRRGRGREGQLAARSTRFGLSRT
jgi:chemotaxis signal transduction protein